MIASRALRLRASEPTCEKEGDESISDSSIIDGSLNTRYCLLDQDLFIGEPTGPEPMAD